MHLDFNTLLWLQLLSTAASAGVLISAVGPSAPVGLREAMLTLVSLAAGYAGLLLRDSVPQPVGILCANPPFWISAAFMHRALSLFGGRRPPRWTFAVVGVGFLLFASVVVLGAPYGLRALLSSALVMVLVGASCWELARDGGLAREPARKITFAFLSLAAAGLLTRVLVLLPRWAEMNRPPTTDLQLALAHVPGLLVAQGFAIGLLLMHQQRVAARANEAATTDALTGCANRRSLEAQVRVELAHAARKGRACALVIGDVDHFKKLNDRLGHSAGDLVLSAVARTLRESVRPGDVVARYGGEEFCVLLREADLPAAAAAADRLCRALRALEIDVNGEAVAVRASFGVAAASAEAHETWESLFRRADAALYRAKEQGRDRVVLDP